jgi:class 3 adenylate cyclase
VPRQPAGEERKVVTVLFCDLVGFTARSDQADPEDVGAMLRPFHARLRGEIERVGGTLDKLIGDAVMAVFGVPAVHEDDPERAVRCALRMLDAIAELNQAYPTLELAVRIGVNTGEALVALERAADSEGVVGDVVNTAARLQGVAPVNGVVVGRRPGGPPGRRSSTSGSPPSRSRARPSRCRSGGCSRPAAGRAWTWPCRPRRRWWAAARSW